MDEYINKFKNNIKMLIDKGNLTTAETLLKEYKNINSDDIETFSIEAIINLYKGNVEKSKELLLEGLNKEKDDFDINYNLGIIYENEKDYQNEFKYYNTALKNCMDENIKEEIKGKLNYLKNNFNIKIGEPKKKIVFFSKGDDKFIWDIINELTKEYETKKITVTNLKQIDEGMRWADICWFEWCDELVVYGSKLELAKSKKIICRLHSYEAFADYIYNVRWENVDKLIFVAEHIKNIVLNKIKIAEEKISIIPNGIDINKFSFKEHHPGFNLAYVGYINFKKGPMLLLHTFKAIYDHDKRYKLYIAGQFQDERDVLYFKQMIKEFGIEKNIFYDGWQNNIDNWLNNKDYILCTSILESQNVSIMQGMCKGIKPVIHNFVGAKKIYEEKYIWNTIDEAVDMIFSNKYNSNNYRRFIIDNFSLDEQLKEIKILLKDMIKYKKNSFDSNYYWNIRLNRKFDIEGVGYIGLGKIYNEYLYKNRIEILNYIVNNVIKIKENYKILELGPGTGIFTDYFAKKNIKDYTAIDISSKSVKELGMKYRNYKFINGDISINKYYNSQYDLIFAADVLLHLTDENNYKSTIKNIANSLTDDGICILLDPISVLGIKSPSMHVVIRDINYIKEIFSDNGLKIIQALPVSFFMNYPFDNKILKNKGNILLNIFEIISNIYSKNDITDYNKDTLCKFLINKERQLIINNNFGLSEKLLIIGKKDNNDIHNIIKMSDIWDKNKLINEEELLLREIDLNNKKIRNLVKLIDEI